MKKQCTLIIMLLIGSIAFSQQLYVETGKRGSSFEYYDSENNKLGNIYSKSYDYLAFGLQNENIIKNVNISIGLIYGGYGAIASDDILEQYMEWNLKYLEYDSSIDVKIFSIRKLKVFMKGGISLGLMTKGTQILNKQVIDLKGNKDFENLLINFKGGVGLIYPISTEVSFFTHYLMGRSNDIIPGDEKLRIVSNNLGIGLLINY